MPHHALCVARSSGDNSNAARAPTIHGHAAAAVKQAEASVADLEVIVFSAAAIMGCGAAARFDLAQTRGAEPCYSKLRI